MNSTLRRSYAACERTDRRTDGSTGPRIPLAGRYFTGIRRERGGTVSRRTAPHPVRLCKTFANRSRVNGWSTDLTGQRFSGPSCRASPVPLAARDRNGDRANSRASKSRGPRRAGTDSFSGTSKSGRLNGTDEIERPRSNKNEYKIAC